MLNNEWGLTKKGFRRPNYTDIIDALERKARKLWGSQINLSVGSFMGLSIRLYAWILDRIFKMDEDIYNSKFIDTAVGTSLYQIGRLIGLRLLAAQKAVGYLEITGVPGTYVPAGFLASTVVGTQYVVLTEGTIGESGIILLPIRAFYAGPDGNTEANTITEIVNPTENNITSITNPKAVEGGRWAETDEEYRDRYYKSVDFAGGVNVDAIRAEILQNVDGIYHALVYENDTDFEDENGLPPHSIEAIGYGGLDQDIAKAIFKRKAAGIQTFGNTSVPIVNMSSQPLNILFTRPVIVWVWIKITSLVTDDSYPHDGEEQIKQALIDYIGGNKNNGLDIGQDVYCNRFAAVLYKISGVVDFDISISTDGVAWNKKRIPISIREKAMTDETKVVIEYVR